MLLELSFAVFCFLTRAMLGSMIKPGVFRHINCRNGVYPRSSIQRFDVPDELVFWTQTYDGYAPPEYTAPHISGQPWADAALTMAGGGFKWNHNDGLVNRESWHGEYKLGQDGAPMNPVGRTGVRGRGLLGRWGPNHAADPIVTRWKRNARGQAAIDESTGRQILQMVAIQRHDNHKWALPGGMVDPGEQVSATLKREFIEEALNFTDSANMVDKFFAGGAEVYKGYVDDFRNTDNAWIETIAMNFHDESGSRVGQLALSAGDDAANVRWLDLSKDLRLHANHIDIVELVATRFNAHW